MMWWLFIRSPWAISSSARSFKDMKQRNQVRKLVIDNMTRRWENIWDWRKWLINSELRKTVYRNIVCRIKEINGENGWSIYTMIDLYWAERKDLIISFDTIVTNHGCYKSMLSSFLGNISCMGGGEFLKNWPVGQKPTRFTATCVKAFAFQSPNKDPLEAQYKRQSLLFEIWFNKLLLGKKLFLGNYRR